MFSALPPQYEKAVSEMLSIYRYVCTYLRVRVCMYAHERLDDFFHIRYLRVHPPQVSVR
jgi:hypothetical protein